MNIGYELFIALFISISYTHVILMILDDYFNEDLFCFEMFSNVKIDLNICFSSIVCIMHLGKFEDFYVNLIFLAITSLIFVNRRVAFKKALVFVLLMSLISIFFNSFHVILYKICDLEQSFYITNSYAMIIIAFILNLFLRLFVRIVKPYFNFLKYNINFRKAYIILVVGLSFFIIYLCLIHSYLNTNSNITSDIIIVIFVINVLGIINFIILNLQMDYNRKIINNTKIKLNYYNRSIKQFRENLHNLRKFKHDLRNHMLVIVSLAKDNKYDELSKYLEKLQYNEEVNVNNFIMTGNPVIDVIINNKLTKAKMMGVKIEASAYIPYNMKLDEFDLVVILGNLLDNAIEATSKLMKEDRYISVKLRYKNEQILIIEIINTYNGNTEFLNNITTKDDKSNHGIGLTSVKDTINKNNGLIDIKYSETNFSVKVMLYT